MLFPSEETRRRRGEIALARQQGRLTDAEAGAQLIEADPVFAGGYTLLANARRAEGDFAGAEAYGWQALERQPCDAGPYLSLAEFRRELSPDDVLARRLMSLGFWKVSFRDEVPEALAELFRTHLPDAQIDFRDPGQYVGLAMAIENQLAVGEDSEDRLLPYLLLNKIEQQGEAGVDPDLLAQMTSQAGRMVPLWAAAVRQWRHTNESPGADALSMMIALLGEMGGPEFVTGLLDLVDSPDPDIFLHCNWAVWRLGQRFPAETLQAFAALPDVNARAAQRCAAAEHISLLPATAGRAAATTRLLEGFADFAKDADAAFLLAAVVSTLEDLSQTAEADRVLQQYRKLLDQDGREWLDEELEAGFVGRLEDAAIEGLDIDDVCFSRALLLDEDDEDEDGEPFDEEDLDEYDDTPLPYLAPVRPGRNDPCWCGSGKKYKKCHLAADEEADRDRS